MQHVIKTVEEYVANIAWRSELQVFEIETRRSTCMHGASLKNNLNTRKIENDMLEMLQLKWKRTQI